MYSSDGKPLPVLGLPVLVVQGLTGAKLGAGVGVALPLHCIGPSSTTCNAGTN